LQKIVANPIALAHFIRVAADHSSATTAEQLDLLTDGWSQPILDPLLHDPDPPGAHSGAHSR
jgi:hypothetical protein